MLLLRFRGRISTPFVSFQQSSSTSLLLRASPSRAPCSVNPVIVVDTNPTFRGSGPANYTLKYNLMPFVGVLTYGEAARVTKPIEFPLARDRVE
jgi:hypothetical protein